MGATPNLFEVNGRALVGVGDKAGRYFAVDRETGAEVDLGNERTRRSDGVSPA